MRKPALLFLAAACGLAACGGGDGSPSKTDPDQAAKLRPLTEKAAAPAVTRGPLAGEVAALDRICADNASRAARATKAGADPNLVAEAAAERLSRLVAGVPRPTDADARYTAWTDALETAANLSRLAADADGDKAKALRDQAERTAAAGRKTAGQLGLRACARG